MNAATVGLMNQLQFYQLPVNSNNTASTNSTPSSSSAILMQQQSFQNQQNAAVTAANFQLQNASNFQFQTPLPPSQNQTNAEMALSLTRQLMGNGVADGNSIIIQQALPNATSTPNPIQQHQMQQHQQNQQQATLINQDLFANLFLKLDANNLFPKNKDQLSFILNQNPNNPSGATAVLVNSANGNVVGSTATGGNPNFAQVTALNGQKLGVNQLSNQQQQQFILEHQMKQHQQQQQQHLPNQMQQQIYLNQQHQLQQGQIYQQHMNQLQSQQQTIRATNTSKANRAASQQQCSDMLNESTSSDGSGVNPGVGERAYKCSQCFKTFRKKVHLNQHVRIHSGDRPYGCDFCEKRFTQLSHLWQHTRRHTGERPYKCDIGSCEKSFTQLSNLQSHLRTHGSAAASSSAIANAANTSVSQNNSNQAINSTLQSLNAASAVLVAAANLTGANNSNNKCSKCFKLLGSKEELQMHMNAKHGGKASRNNAVNKRHYCEFCHKRFATEGVIRSHLCSKQLNAALVRNNEGSLILKAINQPH